MDQIQMISQYQTPILEAATINTTTIDRNSESEGEGQEADDLMLLVSVNQVDMVREKLRDQPGLAWSKTPDGTHAVHVVCHNDVHGDGHDAEMMGLLLKTQPQLCFVKDRRGEYPLHTATRKGKERVVKAIVEACPESIERQLSSSTNETALHLAVRHKKDGVFRVLMDQAQRNKSEVLHFKDLDGNTVLHTAAIHKQVKILRWLLEDNDTHQPLVRATSRNVRGYTALEEHLDNIEECNDVIITHLLKAAESRWGSQPSPRNSQSSSDDTTDKFTTKSKLLLTFSSLIAGSIYTSIFNLNETAYVIDKAIGLQEIFLHPGMLPHIFYCFIFMTVALTASLVGVVVSFWSVIKEWSFCYLAVPLLGLGAFFLSYAFIMKDKVPKFWLATQSFKISSFCLVWMYSQALIILILLIVWFGAKLVLSCPCKPNRPQEKSV